MLSLIRRSLSDVKKNRLSKLRRMTVVAGRNVLNGEDSVQEEAPASGSRRSGESTSTASSHASHQRLSKDGPFKRPLSPRRPRDDGKLSGR
jgi:hypothetical protein